MRCRFLIGTPNTHPASALCFFCSDLKGIMMRDPVYGWCHHTCVNWIPDVWFADDTKQAIDGKTNPDRYRFGCSICKSSKFQGTSTITCDYKECTNSFHIRCAIDKGLIKDWESMNENREVEESYECFIFCSKHLECGKRDLKQGGKSRIMPRNPAIVEKERLKKLVGEG
jgi:hypothetical protein